MLLARTTPVAGLINNTITKGQGVLEWEQGVGYVHTSCNPVNRLFGTVQARTGWIRKFTNRCDENWSLCYEIDTDNPLQITAWMEEVI